MKFIYGIKNIPQTVFLNSNSRYLLFLGGRGSGKSFGGCIKALKWALSKKEPTIGMIVSPTYNQNETIMEQLWELMWNVEVKEEEKKTLELSKLTQEGQPIVVARYNKKDRIIELINGSKIYFRSGDDPEKLRGYNLDWAYIDEAAQVDKLVFDNVDLCLRRGKEQQLWMTTTPKGYNWLYWEKDNFYTITASTYDNQEYLPESYIDSLERLSGAWKEQEINASFITMEGLVFPPNSYRVIRVEEWLKNLGLEKDAKETGTKGSSMDSSIANNYGNKLGEFHRLGINPTSAPSMHKSPQISLAIGIDVGYTSQSAIICTLKINKDTYYTFAEHYETQLTSDDLVGRLGNGGHTQALGLVVPKLEQFLNKKIPVIYYVDSARPDIVESLKRKGFNARFAKKDIISGLDVMLRSNWFIAPECENLLKELGMYSWGLADKPVKGNDHAIDAARYSFMGLAGNREITYQKLGFYASDEYYSTMR